MEQAADIKNQLYQQCVAYVKKRTDEAAYTINAAQQGANEETKSSAGDKYETGRAMMQQEAARNIAQLNEANKLKIALNRVAIGVILSKADVGGVVITNNGRFFIAIGAGVLLANGESYMAVSPESPIGQKLRGTQKGGSFTLNGRSYSITDIF